MKYEILLDAGETPNKCTIAPLATRPDFRLSPVYPIHGKMPLGPFSAPILLHHEGRCISELRDGKFQGSVPSALASVDCVWRRLPDLLERLQWVEGKEPVLARIPDGFLTAYPRVSAKSFDPAGGLATIEAIFIAAALFGNYDASLLSKYYFGRAFIDLNKKRFEDFGIREFTYPEIPPTSLADRNSLTRRRNRGRMPL